MIKLEEVINLLDEKKVEDIVSVDVKDRTPFSEYYVIGTASNERQLEAIAQILDDYIYEKEKLFAKKDGTPESGWYVVDIGNIVIHVMTKDKRELFKLEEIK